MVHGYFPGEVTDGGKKFQCNVLTAELLNVPTRYNNMDYGAFAVSLVWALWFRVGDVGDHFSRGALPPGGPCSALPPGLVANGFRRVWGCRVFFRGLLRVQ